MSNVLPMESTRVLVVDDVSDSAAIFATMLEIYGAETRVALDGYQAIREAEAYRPNIVLMDVTMPGLNGYEAAKRIREQDWGRAMLLIAITGWGQDRDVREAYDAGFDGHLLKPVEPDALFGLIQRLQEERSPVVSERE